MEGFNAFIGRVQEQILDPIITLITLAAFILFAWGLVQFILGADNPEKRSTGQQHMLWGIIGLVIIFGAQVIVRILKNIVGAD
jgi:hypothetical protein